MHAEGSAQAAGLVEGWKALWEGRCEGPEQERRKLARTLADGEPAAGGRKTADYLATHQARLRYPLFRQAGSGVVEGGCEHVIDLRFRRESTRWKEPGARAVLHLRLDVLNERWHKRCQLLQQV